MNQRQQRLELSWYNKDKALIPSEHGKYAYTWVDPSDPRYCETHVLVVDRYIGGLRKEKQDELNYSELADLAPATDNLAIVGESGDVLETLVRLPELSDKYLGKVQLIYIDPPFNTEKTFANYEDNLEHSVWLTMMRDRLLNMRLLLADTGSIWVHLDDAEVHRMRCLLDEIFGEENFLASINVEVNPKGRQLGEGLARTDDTILVYSKSKENLVWTTGTTEGVNVKDFPFRTEDGTPFRLLPLRNTNKRFNPETNPNLYYPLYGNPHTGAVSIEEELGFEIVYPVFGDLTPAVWRWGKEKASVQLQDLQAREVNGQAGTRLDIFQKDMAPPDRTKKIKMSWRSSEVGHSDQAKAEIKAIFPEEVPFATPKPEKLLERIIHIGSRPGDIVLDVFGGSGTTAAVAQKMGRRWVTCELVEDTFNRFTKPRLEKVVLGEDMGGVSVSSSYRVPAEGVALPEGISADDAAKFSRQLAKVARSLEIPLTDKTLSKLKKQLKTERVPEKINWRGGGGFYVAHLAPACYDYAPEIENVFLTESATGRLLVRSVAANLGFYLLPETEFFDGRRGRMLLKVHEGVLTLEMLESWVSKLTDDEALTVASTSIPDGAREELRRLSKHSRLLSIPEQLF